MTVAERREGMGRDGGQDRFPVGMRVLAVDDDPTCLKVLETLLIRCQYHVTTTGQAEEALRMLRENKDKFDLVISDVQMPDMDGFKLLELVGLEMDLPVIMMSGNGETQAVMKGITHGACDYLLKPIRIEELRNIWQHVIRRRRFDVRDHDNSDDGEECDKARVANSEGGRGLVMSGVSDCNGNVGKKRKDQKDEDDAEDENYDPSTQKKQRVVWSMELHGKFVSAVKQLGIDKAVPKKILDLMNVEELTRENVASHLQKYRLYLKRLSAVASQQYNMVATFGGGKPPYIPMSSLDGFRNFHSLVGPKQLHTITSFPSNGTVGKMNNPPGFGQHRLFPSGIAQHGLIHNTTSNHDYDIGKLQGISQLGDPQGNILQGKPMTLQLNRMQHHKPVPEANHHLPGGSSGSGPVIGSSSNSFGAVINGSLLLQAKQRHTQFGVLNTHSSVRIPSLSSDPFKPSLEDSSHLPDFGRCNDTWQAAIPSTSYSTSTSPMTAPASYNYTSNISNNVSPVISDINFHEVSSSSAAVAPLLDSFVGNNREQQLSLPVDRLMQTGVNETLGFLSNSTQKWEKQKQNNSNNCSIAFGCSLYSSSPNIQITDSLAENLTMNNGLPNENVDTAPGASFVTQDFKVNWQLNYKEEYIPESAKSCGDFSYSGCSFDGDLVNVILKPNDTNYLDADIASDIHSLGTCM